MGRSGGYGGRLVFGAYGFSSHATHHRELAIPHYRLDPVTAGLAEYDPGFAPSAGYLRTLWRLSRSEGVGRNERRSERQHARPHGS